jgi:L-fuconolactonase
MTATADAHLHIFPAGYRGVLGASPTGGDEFLVYEHIRADYGIERALVVGYEEDLRYRSNNGDVLALATDRPWMAPLAYLPVAPPPYMQSLHELFARGAVGYSLYLNDRTEAITFDRWPDEIFSELCAQSALISINAPSESAAELRNSVEHLDDGCAVLFSNLGLPGRDLATPTLVELRDRIDPLLDLARFLHVGVKVSGLYAVSDPPRDFPQDAAHPFIALLLESFGPSRMMWALTSPSPWTAFHLRRRQRSARFRNAHL